MLFLFFFPWCQTYHEISVVEVNTWDEGREEYGWINRCDTVSDFGFGSTEQNKNPYSTFKQTTLSALPLPQTTSYPLPHSHDKQWNPNLDWAETPNATLLLAVWVAAFARFQILFLTDTDSNLLVRFRIHTQLSRCSMPNACADLLIQHSISVSIFFMPLFVVFLHLLCLHVCLCPPKCCFGSHFVSSVITLEESMAVRLGCCAFVMIWLV